MATLTMNMKRTWTDDQASPRFSLEMAGVLALLLGAWGGIVPFVGPLFGFSGDGSKAWHWSLAHALLFLLPGAVAMVMGLAAVLVGRRRGRGWLADLAGLSIVVCGAWFVVGAIAWPVIANTQVFRATATPRGLAYWIGYSLGPGGLLMAIGAFILGNASAPPALAVSESDWRVVKDPVPTAPL